MNVSVWKYKCGMVLIYNKYVDWVDKTCSTVSLSLSHWPDNVTTICVGLFITLIFYQTVQLSPSIKCAWHGGIQNCFYSILGTVTCLPRNMVKNSCTSLHIKKKKKSNKREHVLEWLIPKTVSFRQTSELSLLILPATIKDLLVCLLKWVFYSRMCLFMMRYT